MLKLLSLKLIRFYQKWLSLDQGVLSGLGIKVCKYSPTCSQYTYDAIEKYGVFKGGLFGGYRILRCNPFTKGGFDPVK